MLGADILVEALHREGITHVFGLPGTTIMNVLDALARREDIRYISTRHEQVAGFMADGYARASGLPSVALASRGPGAANLTIAVHNAHAESIPLVAVVGQVPDDIVHRDSFEETDLVAQFKPITKWAVEVHDPARIPELVQRAVRMASSGRPGPVLVSVPMDAQTRDTEPAFQPYFRPAPGLPLNLVTRFDVLFSRHVVRSRRRLSRRGLPQCITRLSMVLPCIYHLPRTFCLRLCHHLRRPRNPQRPSRPAYFATPIRALPESAARSYLRASHPNRSLPRFHHSFALRHLLQYSPRQQRTVRHPNRDSVLRLPPCQRRASSFPHPEIPE